VLRTGGFKVHAALGPPLEMVRTGDSEEDLRVNTSRLLKLFEEHLKKDPGQWSVLDQIWKEDVPGPDTSPPHDEPATEPETVQ
jgi:hypothetical protein